MEHAVSTARARIFICWYVSTIDSCQFYLSRCHMTCYDVMLQPTVDPYLVWSLYITFEGNHFPRPAIYVCRQTLYIDYVKSYLWSRYLLFFRWSKSHRLWGFHCRGFLLDITNQFVPHNSNKTEFLNCLLTSFSPSFYVDSFSVI